MKSSITMNSLQTSFTEYAYGLYTDTLSFYSSKAENREPNRSHSIYDGRLGYSFFLLELYKRTARPAVWNSILEELNWINGYSSRNPTNNYSLLCGQLGTALLYTDLFELTGEQQYLGKALSLVKEYFDSNSFKYGIITRHGLFNGTAGILLLTHRLYQLSREAWLLDHLEGLLLKLIRSLEYSDDGIYWGGITNRDRGNIGLVSGGAGIAFTLGVLGRSFHNSFLVNLARLALRYEAAHNSSGTLKEQSLGHGLSGMMLVSLYMDIAGAGATGQPALPFPDAQAALPEGSAYGIFTGLPGIGLAHIETYRITGEKSYHNKAAGIATQLIQGCDANKPRIPYSMEGLWGLGYFLLRLEHPAADDDGPFFLRQNNGSIGPNELPAASIFRKDNKAIYEMYINSSFEKTLSLLKKECPEKISLFLHEDEKLLPEDILEHFRELIAAQENIPGSSPLLFHMEKEAFVLSVRKALKNSIAPDVEDILSTYETVQLNRSEFMLLNLVQSGRIFVFSKESAFSDQTMLTKESLPDFFRQYGTKTVFYRLTTNDTLMASELGILKIIFDQFTVATPVATVHQQLLHFLLSQPAEVLHMLAGNYRENDGQSVHEILSEIIWDGIQHCFAENLLELAG
jgi:hypothetical protein